MDNNEHIKLMADVIAIVRQAMTDLKKEFERNEPLHSIGDKVWIVHGNNVFSERIASIQQYYTKDGKDLYYLFEGLGTVPASLVYRSKQNLIEAQIIYWQEELAKLEDNKWN